MAVAQSLVVGLVLLGLLVGAVVWKRRQGGEREVNYKAFFILGVTFLPVGVTLSTATDNPGLMSLTGLGVAYIAIGLANRDKWKK